MKQEPMLKVADLDERTQQAVHELQAAILVRFPETRFELAPGADDPGTIHLFAIADVDDLDEVGDLVVERVVAMIVDEGIPLHVIPMPAPQRRQAALATECRMVSQRSVRAG